MNDGSFFLYIYFRARVRPLLPTHIHRALPSASIGSDRFRAACLPPRFSYHYCLRSLIMHRSGSVHLLCVSRLPPLPSRGSYGFSNHLLLSTVGCRTVEPLLLVSASVEPKWMGSVFSRIFFCCRLSSLISIRVYTLLRALFAIEDILLLLFLLFVLLLLLLFL